MTAKKVGRRKGSRNGDSLTGRAIRYMHDRHVSQEVAAKAFGISWQTIRAALRSGNYDTKTGDYIGR